MDEHGVHLYDTETAAIDGIKTLWLSGFSENFMFKNMLEKFFVC